MKSGKMNKKQLTVIIPFLNEKEEVRNTVKSIREHSNNDEIIIILINDASNDGFDYEEISKEYKTEYVVNSVRLGVAASRDLGIKLCQTPYFLLLDAHMRFYDTLWLYRILEELNKDSKLLLCCQTQGLTFIDNELIIIKGRSISYGANIDLYQSNNLFECRWLFKEDEKNLHLQAIDIPCVLGAAYACSKKYWTYLRGLTGLKYFGNDEAYISMKVWLEGGNCKLLKDVIIGHIYRDFPPYTVENTPRIYNRLLIAELLLPEYHKARIHSQIKCLYKEIFNEAFIILYQNRGEIYTLKEYYKKILQYDFSYFEELNNHFNTFEDIIPNKEDILREIAQHLVLHCNLSLNIGLFNGKLGIIIFLFHYAQYVNNDIYNQFAEKILEEVFNYISDDIPLNFFEGLLGIGWSIEYLYQNKFIEGDTNEILEELDRKVLKINIETMNDLTIDKGLGGITHYVLARLYTIEMEDKHNPFKPRFLLKLYDKIKSILDLNKGNIDNIELFIRYLLFFEKIILLRQPSIYDITYLVIPEDYEIKNFTLSIDGNAGVGLKLIFEEFR